MSDVLTEETRENFLAEAEVMDLSPIREKTFMVAISTGDLNKVKFLCSSIHGPFSFVEMCQEVGEMWVQHQHPAKVIIPSKDNTKPVEILDADTVDYIQCHYADIITEEMLGGAFDEDKKYTCRAGTSARTDQIDPRHVKKEEKAEESKEDEDL